MLPTRWQPIWQNNYCLATTWYFTRGRELYMKCQGKHWPWQADHWSNPLASCDNGATHGGFRISLTASLHTLWVWGWWNDYEWCGWWLWRRMIANTARPEPQGANQGPIHLHTHLPSPRGQMSWLGPERYSQLATHRPHILEVTSLEISASLCLPLLDSYPDKHVDLLIIHLKSITYPCCTIVLPTAWNKPSPACLRWCISGFLVSYVVSYEQTAAATVFVTDNCNSLTF